MEATEGDLAPDIAKVLAEVDRFERSGDVVGAVTSLCSAYVALAGVDVDGARAAEERARSLLSGLGSDGFEDLLELDVARRSVALQGVEMAYDYLRSKYLRAAEDACLVTIERIPDYLPIQIMLAQVYIEEGKLERAVEKYQCLIDLYLARDRKRKAIDVLRRALRVGAADEGKRQELISWMMNEGLTDQALQETATIAKAHLENGEIDVGLRLYDQMVQAAPDNAWVHLDYGRVLEGLGRTSQATAHYALSRDLKPDELEPCWRIARGSVLEGSWEGLESTLEALTDLIVPGTDEAAAAVEGLRWALDNSPSGAIAHLCLGMVLARVGNLREAEVHLQEAFVETEGVPVELQLAARMLLGQALLCDGQSDKVVALLSDSFGQGLAPARRARVGP